MFIRIRTEQIVKDGTYLFWCKGKILFKGHDGKRADGHFLAELLQWQTHLELHVIIVENS
jgi:hypothetical protein